MFPYCHILQCGKCDDRAHYAKLRYLYVGLLLNATKVQELYIIDYVSVSSVPILGLVHSRHLINIYLIKKQTNFKNHPLPIPSACNLYTFFCLKSLVSYLLESVFLFKEVAVMALKKMILEFKNLLCSLAPLLLAIVLGKSLNLFVLVSSGAK